MRPVSATRDLLLGVLASSFASLLAVAVFPLAGPLTPVLLLVLGITAAGATFGLASAIAAALVGSLVYTLFLTEPELSFHLSGRDMMPLAAFPLVALIVGLLAGRARQLAGVAQRRNKELAALLDTSNDLQSARDPDDAIARLLASAGSHTGIRLNAFRINEGRLARSSAPDPPGDQEAADLALAASARTRDNGSLLAIPLAGRRGTLGVLVAELARTGGERRDDAAFVTALANLLTLALERAELDGEAIDRAAGARSEELKTALLASVSHDFRTPLSTISASASSLLQLEAALSPEQRQALLRSIIEECDRLNRYTANLLEFSRLQAGTGDLNAPIVDAADLVRSALHRVRPRLAARNVSRDIPERMFPVRAEPALFELVLLNVIENAARYAGDSARIAIGIREHGGEVLIEVADDGVGIPPEDLPHIFERFHRVRRNGSGPGGSGLGLPIAKAFVEAFGGGIVVESPGLDDHGTCVIIRLPLAEPCR